MLSKLMKLPSSSCAARQQQQLSWQQHYHPWASCHPSQLHEGSCQSQRHSLIANSTLDRLNIQPLVLPPEAQRLPDQPDSPAAPTDLHIPPLDAWGQDPFLMAGCEPESAPLRVAVLVSGGVDSSLALKLVTAAGHQATAFYLQIWFQEDFRNFWDACPWEEDLSYAQQVCDALGVPLVVVPLTEQYWDRVVSHSVAEIKAGRTPNPDMLCNSRVKFGAFYEYLQQEHAGSFDRIASGHYAKVQRLQAAPAQQPEPAPAASGQQPVQQQHHAATSYSSSSGVDADSSAAALLERQASHAGASSRGSSSDSSSGGSSGSSSCRLLMVPDAVKDQTYFLANLSPSQLSRCMFPLGSFTKPQVRALAAAAGLATSGRKDSQGICFLGKVKFGEFVGEHLGVWPGPLVEEESGQVVGVHDGYWFYTVGQRGGIKLPGGPWYVTRKDMHSNIVYVSRTYYEQERRRDAFVCGPINWLGSQRPQQQQQHRPLFVKVRHGPNVYECSLQLGRQEEVMGVLEQGTHASFQSLVHPAGELSHGQNSSSSSDGNGSSGQLGSQDGSGVAEQQQYGVVLLSENDQGLAAGQYAVFYQDGECLGSAQIMGGLARSAVDGSC